jgi:peptide deformylase
MGLRNIVLEGDEVLRKRAKEIKDVDERIRILLDDMWETLEAHNGVGLAAPQVGVLRRAVVIDTGEEGERYELINPVLVSSEGVSEDEEGCLSLPGVVGVVERPLRATVKSLNREGEEITVEGEGLLAKALCHEIDHLNGVLLTDIALSWEIRNNDKNRE